MLEHLLAAKLPGAELRWPGRRLHLADGTCVSKPGSTGTDWRVHGVFDLGRGGFSHLELTDKHGAETLARGAPLAGEIRIGDRDYARAPVLQRLLADGDGKADFIVRVGWNALQLHTPAGRPFDLIAYLQSLPAYAKPHEVHLFPGLFPLRTCSTRPTFRHLGRSRTPFCCCCSASSSVRSASPTSWPRQRRSIVASQTHHADDSLTSDTPFRAYFGAYGAMPGLAMFPDRL